MDATEKAVGDAPSTVRANAYEPSLVGPRRGAGVAATVNKSTMHLPHRLARRPGGCAAAAGTRPRTPNGYIRNRRALRRVRGVERLLKRVLRAFPVAARRGFVLVTGLG